MFIYLKSGLIEYDDNSLYQDEDVSNYNASLYEPIGDDELVYIVCRTKTIYYNNNNVELSLIILVSYEKNVKSNMLINFYYLNNKL